MGVAGQLNGCIALRWIGLERVCEHHVRQQLAKIPSLCWQMVTMHCSGLSLRCLLRLANHAQQPQIHCHSGGALQPQPPEKNQGGQGMSSVVCTHEPHLGRWNAETQGGQRGPTVKGTPEQEWKCWISNSCWSFCSCPLFSHALVMTEAQSGSKKFECWKKIALHQSGTVCDLLGLM